jgi:hypothetical protein
LIGEKLIEVNVTSPTGIQELARFLGRPVEAGRDSLGPKPRSKRAADRRKLGPASPGVQGGAHGPTL